MGCQLGRQNRLKPSRSTSPSNMTDDCALPIVIATRFEDGETDSFTLHAEAIPLRDYDQMVALELSYEEEDELSNQNAIAEVRAEDEARFRASTRPLKVTPGVSVSPRGKFLNRISSGYTFHNLLHIDRTYSRLTPGLNIYAGFNDCDDDIDIDVDSIDNYPPGPVFEAGPPAQRKRAGEKIEPIIKAHSSHDLKKVKLSSSSHASTVVLAVPSPAATNIARERFLDGLR